MAEVVNILRHIAEQQQEGCEEDHDEDDFELEDEADLSEGRPIDDDISDAQSDHPIKTGRRPRLQHWLSVEQVAENVAGDACEYKHDEHPRFSESILEATDQ